MDVIVALFMLPLILLGLGLVTLTSNAFIFTLCIVGFLLVAARNWLSIR